MNGIENKQTVSLAMRNNLGLGLPNFVEWSYNTKVLLEQYLRMWGWMIKRVSARAEQSWEGLINVGMRVYAEADGWSPQDGLELVAPALIGSKRCPASRTQPARAAASACVAARIVWDAGLDTVDQCYAVLPWDAGRVHGCHDPVGVQADDACDATASPPAAPCRPRKLCPAPFQSLPKCHSSPCPPARPTPFPSLSTPKSTPQWPTAPTPSHGPLRLFRSHLPQQRTPQDEQQPEFYLSQQEQQLPSASS